MAVFDADGNSRVNMTLKSFGEVHCAMIFFVMLQLIVAEVHGAAAETSTSSHDDDHATHAVDDHSSSHAGDDHHDDHHNLFTLGSDLDATKASLCLLMLIAFTVVLETCLTWLEHLLRGKTHYLAMLNKVERELMILGFISFVLFLTETTGGALQLGESWLVPFEFAHFLIFFVAIFYTLQAFWLAVMVSRSQAYWKKIDDQTRSDLVKMLRAEASVRPRFLSWLRLHMFSEVPSLTNFFLIKFLLIRSHDLPTWFNFQEYVQRGLQHHVKELLDVRATTWLILLAFLALTIGAVEYGTGNLSPDQSIKGFILIGWVFVVVDSLVLHSVRSAIRRVLEQVVLQEEYEAESLADHLENLRHWIENKGPLRKRRLSTTRYNDTLLRDLAEEDEYVLGGPGSETGSDARSPREEDGGCSSWVRRWICCMGRRQANKPAWDLEKALESEEASPVKEGLHSRRSVVQQQEGKEAAEKVLFARSLTLSRSGGSSLVDHRSVRSLGVSGRAGRRSPSERFHMDASSRGRAVGRSTRQASFRRGTSFGFENVSSFDTRTSGSGGGGLAFPLSGDPNRKFSATSMPFRPSKADVARFLEAARSGEKEDEEVDSEAEGRVDEFMTSGQASPVRYPNGPGGSRGRAIHSGSIKRGGRGGRRVVKEESVKDFDVNKDDEIAKTAERLTRYISSASAQESHLATSKSFAPGSIRRSTSLTDKKARTATGNLGTRVATAAAGGMNGNTYDSHLSGASNRTMVDSFSARRAVQTLRAASTATWSRIVGGSEQGGSDGGAGSSGVGGAAEDWAQGEGQAHENGGGSRTFLLDQGGGRMQGRKEEDDDRFQTLDFSYAFWLGRPWLFKVTLDTVMLFNCVYLALFACYYVHLTLEEYKHTSAAFLLSLMLLPTLGRTAVLTPPVFQSYNILLCVSQVETVQMSGVLEVMMQEIRTMRTGIVLLLREKLGDRGREGLRDLFREFDVNQDGVVDPEEFRETLTKMGWKSRRFQFRSLLHLFNPRGGKLGFAHFDDLIYPKSSGHWAVEDDIVWEEPNAEKLDPFDEEGEDAAPDDGLRNAEGDGKIAHPPPIDEESGTRSEAGPDESQTDRVQAVIGLLEDMLMADEDDGRLVTVEEVHEAQRKRLSAAVNRLLPLFPPGEADDSAARDHPRDRARRGGIAIDTPAASAAPREAGVCKTSPRDIADVGNDPVAAAAADRLANGDVSPAEDESRSIPDDYDDDDDDHRDSRLRSQDTQPMLDPQRQRFSPPRMNLGTPRGSGVLMRGDSVDEEKRCGEGDPRYPRDRRSSGDVAVYQGIAAGESDPNERAPTRNTRGARDPGRDGVRKGLIWKEEP